jgi:hypothetical protein
VKDYYLEIVDQWGRKIEYGITADFDEATELAWRQGCVDHFNGMFPTSPTGQAAGANGNGA